MRSLSPDSEQRTLQEAFLFSDADLNANRLGSLSENQARALQNFQRMFTSLSIIPLIGIGALMLWMLGQFIVTRGLGSLLFFILLIPVGLITYRRYANDQGHRPKTVQLPEVHTQTGVAQFPAGPIRPNQRYPMVMFDGLEFHLRTNRQHQAIQSGRTYRVYYLTQNGANTIISIEML